MSEPMFQSKVNNLVNKYNLKSIMETLKAPEKWHLALFFIFIINFERFERIFLVHVLLTLLHKMCYFLLWLNKILFKCVILSHKAKAFSGSVKHIKATRARSEFFLNQCLCQKGTHHLCSVTEYR